MIQLLHFPLLSDLGLNHHFQRPDQRFAYTQIAGRGAENDGLSLKGAENAVTVSYPRESEGICFHRRWFVCLSVGDHDN